MPALSFKQQPAAPRRAISHPKEIAASTLIALGALIIVAALSAFTRLGNVAAATIGDEPKPAAASITDSASEQKLLVLGDSLSAEYGIERGSGWVSLLRSKLDDHEPPLQVVNASISGETTAGGRARIEDLLARHQPAVIVLELGGNDALRGLDLDSTERNLQEMADLSRATGAEVVVIGIQVPPNYGRRYTERLAGIFDTVARDNDARLVPFFFVRIMERQDAFLEDRIHPSQSVQPVLLDTAWPAIESVIKKLAVRPSK